MAEINKQTEMASTGNVDWSVFLQEGVIVSLTIKRYRGVTTIDFSELGIERESSDRLNAFLGDYITLGSKRLLPPKIEGKLKSIETTARQNLKDCSFDCSAFASQGKFVPKDMYSEFKAKNERLQTQFFELRDSLAENYDALLAKVQRDYAVLAENLFRQSHPDGTPIDKAYVKAFTEAIVSQIPSSDEIIASFEYETRLSYIPDYLMNVMRKKNNIDERAMKIAASNPSRPAHKEPEDEIARDIRQSIETQSDAMVADFIAETQIRLLTFAFEGGKTIVDSIDRNNGKLVGRASIKTTSLIKDVRGLNYGDKKLAELIDSLEYALNGGAEGVRNVAEVRAAAHELQLWAEKQIEVIHSETVARKADAIKNPGKRQAPLPIEAGAVPSQPAASPANKGQTQKAAQSQAKKAVPSATRKTASPEDAALRKKQAGQTPADATQNRTRKPSASAQDSKTTASKTGQPKKGTLTTKAAAQKKATKPASSKKASPAEVSEKAQTPPVQSKSPTPPAKKKKNLTISVPKKAQPRRTAKKQR